MNNGWVKLHRQIFDNDLWLSEPFSRSQAWIDLFANANHKNSFFYIRGNKIEVQRGQLGWSILTMSKRWQWSRQKVRHFLAHLEKSAQIRQQKLYKLTTIITIIKYDEYQDVTTDVTTERQQKDNRLSTNKNVKKEKNISDKSGSGLKTKRKDMSWKKPYNESNHSDDIPTLDMDSREIEGEDESGATAELNKKIRTNLKKIESIRGLSFGSGKDMNFHVKIYRDLLGKGWSHQVIVGTFLDINETDHWREKKEQGEFPGMNTVQYHLRNKQPS